MPYASVYSESARRARCVPPWRKFYMTPLRWSACTAALGWLGVLCILAAGLRLTHRPAISQLSIIAAVMVALAKFLSS